MTTMLILNIPPALEEDLIDYLLLQQEVGGFTSYGAEGHGEHKILTIAEQVSGRSKRMQFELLLEQEAVPAIVSGLAEEVGADITYWQQDVHSIGRT